MDRRQFLVRAAAGLGALITPSFLRDAQAFVQAEASPLLLPPAVAAKRTLIAVPMHSGYSLHVGTPFEPCSGLDLARTRRGAWLLGRGRGPGCHRRAQR